jgi:hypothetical protein
MRVGRWIPSVALLCATAAAGCAGDAKNGLPATSFQQLPGSEHLTKPIVGVYISDVTTGPELLEYSYTGKGSPLCSLSLSGYVGGQIQSDSKNELIVPEFSGSTGTIAVYNEGKTGRSCLPLAPKFAFQDPYGSPDDGFSMDGHTYYIAHAYGAKGSSPQAAVCQTGRRFGCNRPLGIPFVSHGVISITANATGVYACAYDPTATPWLVYWKVPKGTGVILNGFTNQYCGGLTFDGLGNLISLDGETLWIYSGCPKACLAHGFSLHGGGTYGSLGNGETTFMVMNNLYRTIDVYQYNGIYGVTYLYSNGTGISASAPVSGIAQRLK